MEDAQAEESVNATDEVDYKAENERLRAELELKQAEVISLNEKLVAMAAGQPSVPSDDIASLSEKLNRLKEEAAKVQYSDALFSILNLGFFI